MLKIGEQAIITTENWFYAPDGCQYKAVFGTIKSITNAENAIGIKVNYRSVDWFVEIGNMTIPGCQLSYVIKCNTYNPQKALYWNTTNGYSEHFAPCSIYNADVEYENQE